MRFYIDETQFSTVAVCLVCDWRGLGADRLTVMVRLALHEEFMHPMTSNCRHALSEARRRGKAVSSGTTKKPARPPVGKARSGSRRPKNRTN